MANKLATLQFPSFPFPLPFSGDWGYLFTSRIVVVCLRLQQITHVEYQNFRERRWDRRTLTQPLAFANAARRTWQLYVECIVWHSQCGDTKVAAGGGGGCIWADGAGCVAKATHSREIFGNASQIFLRRKWRINNDHNEGNFSTIFRNFLVDFFH